MSGENTLQWWRLCCWVVFVMPNSFLRKDEFFPRRLLCPPGEYTQVSLPHHCMKYNQLCENPGLGWSWDIPLQLFWNMLPLLREEHWEPSGKGKYRRRFRWGVSYPFCSSSIGMIWLHNCIYIGAWGLGNVEKCINIRQAFTVSLHCLPC